MTRKWLGSLLLVLTILLGEPSGAATLSQARSSAIAWLESHQNPDGAWGSGETQPLVTAEAVLALAKAERAAGAPARRAQTWLLNHEYASLDYRARAIRALAVSGVDVFLDAKALHDMGAAAEGWGLTSERGLTSYDTALVLAAIKAGGVTPITGETAKLTKILNRRRGDKGWSGDTVPVPLPAVAGEASDRTVTAEIVRALVGFNTPGWGAESQNFISSDTTVTPSGQAVTPQTDTLEIASRLAALYAANRSGAITVGLEAELLNDARLTAAGVWSDTDAFVNAIGLLAVTTKPGTTYPTSCANPADYDCDEFEDPVDAFPHDAAEHADSDGDGIGDFADSDRDGDGFCDPGESGGCSGIDLALFADDPTEHADSDNDNIGDNDESDADDDGISDIEEIERGTSPWLADTDEDGSDDSEDCPLIALGAGMGVDADQDGVCTPLDGCDSSPSPVDISDLDGDHVCDGADDDDDGDTVSDRIELAAGSDPRDAASVPANLALADPDGDFDRDDLTNAEEVVTSPFLADTDDDGAIDSYELGVVPATAPNDPASQPPAVIAVFGSIGASEPEIPGAPFEPELSSAGGELRATMTGGQCTPVALPGAPQAPSSGPGFVSLAGFQPQTVLARDLDGDGLTGGQEFVLGTSGTNVDSDGDLFVDGAGDLVAMSRLPGGWDLEPDTKVDGEQDFGTDPADREDHPGKPGDVAPLGHPDGHINVADAAVELRLIRDPTLTEGLNPQNAAIATQAADANGDDEIGAADPLQILRVLGLVEP